MPVAQRHGKIRSSFTELRDLEQPGPPPLRLQQEPYQKRRSGPDSLLLEVHSDRELELVLQLGDRIGEVCARGNRGAMLLRMGDLDQARQQLERAVALSRSNETYYFEARFLPVLSRLTGRKSTKRWAGMPP